GSAPVGLCARTGRAGGDVVDHPRLAGGERELAVGGPVVAGERDLERAPAVPLDGRGDLEAAGRGRVAADPEGLVLGPSGGAPAVRADLDVVALLGVGLEAAQRGGQ